MVISRILKNILLEIHELKTGDTIYLQLVYLIYVVVTTIRKNNEKVII